MSWVVAKKKESVPSAKNQNVCKLKYMFVPIF